MTDTVIAGRIHGTSPVERTTMTRLTQIDHPRGPEVTIDQSVTTFPTPRVRPSRLGTPSGVRRELARLYLDARKDRVNPNAAAKLAYILTCLHKAIETERVEQRIADLEKLVAHRNGA